MMENRSFDHFLGWLPGADGKQAGLAFVDRYARRHRTFHQTQYSSCGFTRPGPLLRGRADRVEQRAGATAGCARAQNDSLSISYYRKPDLAFLGRGRDPLDGLRPVLLRDDGRDLPEPLLPARGAAPTGSTTRRRSRTCRPSGIGSPTPGLSGRYYFSDIPFLALWGTKYLSISKPFARVPRRRGRRPAAARQLRRSRGSRTSPRARRTTTTRTPTSAPGRRS